MLRLYLLRHGKTKSATDLADIDRPLAERGHQDAAQMGRRLVDWGATPSLVLCSAAQRARETLAGVVPSLNGNTRIEVEGTLYTFDPNEIMRRLIQIPDSDTDVLLIGHNPALEVTTGLLAADGNPAAMRLLSLKFPTCALAALEFTTDSWPALGPNTGRLAKLSTPKDD